MKIPRAFTTLLLCLPALLCAPQARGQRPTPTPDEAEEVIRLDTELIQVRAVVTDSKGRPVDGLTRDDFEVFEDGQPQPVSFFSVERAPGVSDPPAGPAVRPKGAAPARTVVLFVDTLHLAPANLLRAKRSMRKFVDEMMTDRDLVAVVSTDGTLGVLQQFMSDRAMLRRAIDRLKPFLKPATAFTPDLAAGVLAGSETAIDAAVMILRREEGYESFGRPEIDRGVATARARDILGHEERLRRVTLDTLAAVSERLAGMKGQRLLAFVSNGFTPYDQVGDVDRLPLQRVMGRAARGGVVIYSLYGIGLYYSTEPMTGTPSPAAESTLREMADATGGRAFLNTNDIGESLQKMLDSNRVHYTLAYYPPKGGDPAKFRKVSVRLKNHAGYSVRTQKGYVPAERPPSPVAATPRERLFKEVLAPLPATALDVSAAAHFLEREGEDAQVTLRVRVGGDKLGYAESGESSLLRCELVALFFDKDGKVEHTVAELITATLTPAQLAEARRSGYLYTRRLKLKPGLYQARVGVREVGSELLGTGSAWVDVPDLSKGGIALSSIFVGRDGALDSRGGGARLLLDGPAFKADEALAYRFVVYNARPPKTPEGADASLKVEVLRGEESVYEGEWQTLTSRAVRSDARGTEAGGRLRLAMPPGLYTLRLTARDARSKKKATQTVDFEVVP